MDKDFWNQRWREGQIGFHASRTHWALEAHWPGLVPAADVPVLVPLCGKSLDMHWLHERGHPVTGLELSELAVTDFFREWPRIPRVRLEPSSGLRWHEADGIALGQGDFFAYRTQAPFSAFYDRAALVALPASMRKAYMTHLRSCLASAAVGLLVTLEYEQDQKDGPPFSVNYSEVSALAGFAIEPLERRDVLADSPRFRDSGVRSLHEAAYRLIAM